jgi:arylsulfatase A-like enzyme
MLKQPNIIYILSDEHRGHAMGHAGDPNVNTPVMDRLASEGVSFSRAYSNCPICTPSRGTIFSGRHAHSGPVSGFFDVYKATAPSTATELRKAGYRTAYFGKWHCGVVRDQIPESFRDRPTGSGTPTTRTAEYHRAGFQDWAAFEVVNAPFSTYVYRNNDENPTELDGYQTDALTDMAIDYINSYSREEPFFLVLSVEPPHFPLDIDDKWKRLSPDSVEVRPNFAKRDGFFPYTPVTPDSDLRQILCNYYACVENLDWNIGRLMDAVSSVPGRAEDTMTVYISDHGDYVGSHGLDTTKIQHHEESVRIPSLFHWPEHIPAQGMRNELFSLVDLFATTLETAGLPVPSHNQGTSFAPALFGRQFTGPDTVLIEMVNNPRWNLRFLDWRGLVTERYKYAFCETGREQLFDLEVDPYELDDLSAKRPQLLEEYRTRLLGLLEETREPYFDVLIEHGVPAEGPVRDVGDKSHYTDGVLRKGGISERPVDSKEAKRYL